MEDPIKHIVVLMLENASFDRVLGCMQSIYPKLAGFDPNITCTNPDFPDTNHEFAQLEVAADRVTVDPGHDLDDVLRQLHNNCQGFVSDFVQHCPQAPQDERYQIMGSFRKGDLPVLHKLAENFLICDHWFSSVPGPTWPNRFFVHSGTSLGHTDMPEGFFHPGIHLYDQPTVYQRLSEKNISWRIYYGDVPQTLVMVEQLRYPLHYSHMDNFCADVQNPADSFPQYVFIEPSYFGSHQNDAHPPTDIRHAEALLANVYNGILSNEDLWQSTLFVILFDEHGGFYDHVRPEPTIAPDDNTKTFAFDKLGVRVPAILVSPWVDPGFTDQIFDHTSLLKYVSDKWKLGEMGKRTAQANSFRDLLTKRSSPRLDCPNNIQFDPAVPINENLPLNAQQVALAGFTHHLEINHTKPDDSIIATHSKNMATSYEMQSKTVAERIKQFFEGLV